jgi:hypothetical protein
MELVPWMMLSAACRVFSVQGGAIALAATGASDLFLFIAFLLGARRMIELTGGVTTLAALSLRQQIRLAHKVLLPVAGLVIAGAVLVYGLGWRWTGAHMMLGFDGIAYDQAVDGFLWSAFLAALTLLLVLRVEMSGDANLFAVLTELWRRARHMAPAIVAVAAADFILSLMQGGVRQIVYAFWTSDVGPALVRALTFFAFVFLFASARLWVTLAILVFALRASYRDGRTPTARGITPS